MPFFFKINFAGINVYIQEHLNYDVIELFTKILALPCRNLAFAASLPQLDY